MDESLDELAARAKDGDAGATDALLRRIQPDVLRICSRILPYRQDAEEAAQDALLRITNNLHRFEGRSRFSTWMYTVASNSARQTYRSLKRRFSESTTDKPIEAPDPRTTSVIAGTRIDVLDALEGLEDRRAELVSAFVLRDFGALSYDEIAAQLGIPVGTAKSRVHDARVHMRTQLANPNV